MEPNFQYSIDVVSGDAPLRFPDNGLQSTQVAVSEPDPQTQPPVLITEIVPDSDNVSGADAYEFIEIYNNSDQSMDLKDYKLSYQYPDGRQETDWDMDRLLSRWSQRVRL